MRAILFLWFIVILSPSLRAQPPLEYIVKSDVLNVRGGAGTEYEIVGKLFKNDRVVVNREARNNWWYIESDGLRGYVFSKYLEEDPDSGWEKTNYISGAAPACENISPQYDFENGTMLRVNVGKRKDVVVKLMKLDSLSSDEKCIRIVYVRSGDVYDIEHIPEGMYYLKIAYGRDYRKRIVDGKCSVMFMKNAEYTKGEVLDYTRTYGPDVIKEDGIYKQWSIASYELFLEVDYDEGEEYDASNISEEEFNK